MEILKLGASPRFLPLSICLLLALATGLLFLTGVASFSVSVVPFFVFGLLTAVGLHDMLQTKRAVLRNYPIAG
ncbi:MAG: FMN-binding glutamate synthase family protein, partial [Pseudaminobacter sp.]